MSILEETSNWVPEPLQEKKPALIANQETYGMPIWLKEGVIDYEIIAKYNKLPKIPLTVYIPNHNYTAEQVKEFVIKCNALLADIK